MDRRDHWNQVYETKGLDDISWFQATPGISLRLIAATGVRKTDPILDVGGGTSLLVDHLLAAGYLNLTVFHFLTEPDDQRRYAAMLAQALPLGAHAIIGTFASMARRSAAACRWPGTMPIG